MNRDEIISNYHDRLQRGDRQKLSTQERDFLVQAFIDRLQSLLSAEAIEQLCQDEIELLELGYGKGTNSTVNYLSKYRTAIAQATEAGKLPMTDATSFMFKGRKRTGKPIQALQHLAFDLMRYDNSVYLSNRKQTNIGNNERQDNPQPFNPDRYLGKAEQLLQAQEPETLAVGIAAVTGRRHTEVAVSGRFSSTRHSYLLTFDGQLKKADPIAYTILTLLPAQAVLEAIDRFRAFPQVQALAGLTSADREVAAFRARVNTRVRHHFQDSQILPLLPGFGSVSVHRLRAAYARVAIHYWLPGQGVNEQRWLQFYLGHVTPGEMRDAANSNSASHYFGYCLVNDQGKPITVTGIKLMANPLPSLSDRQVQQQQAANDRLDSDTTELDFTRPEEAVMSPTQHEVEEVAIDLQTLPEKESLPSSTTQEPTEAAPAAHQPSKPKRSKPRYRELRVNLVDLSAAADRLGLDSSGRTGYQSLLDRVLLTVPSAPTEQAIPDPNHLLAPLLQELAAIKQQVSVGQQAEELEQLRQQTEQQQQEIDRLRTELQTAHDRLAQIAAAAQGLAGVQLTPVPQPAPIQPPPVNQPPVQQPAPTPRPALGRPSFGKLSPSDRVPLAIAALIHHNQNCPPHDRWYLSGNVIATAAGANPALVVTPWLQSHPIAVEQLDQHNAAIGLNARSNGKDKDRGQLKPIYQQFIEGKAIEELRAIVQKFENQTD
ncbi:protelomerase family protein [Leptolyngbya ohadii]|uniref:protelomerase family protein n=1 Tax=Leptolyngbya ohadii TaxID=1962290 RepID=UPI000B59A1A1|nr:protelomerase family protein [Leptolyngbya ohadii]